MASIFQVLNAVNVNDNTETKNGLTYLSWAWAWAEVKKAFPSATYTIYERETEFGPVNYFTDGRTCWVKTGVTIEGLEHIEQLPVMDYRNKSIPLNAVTSMDVNKTIQRSLTKACARHGLGLYIYAGEDLPEDEKKAQLQEAHDKRTEKPVQPADAKGKVTPVQAAKPAEKGDPDAPATAEQIEYIKGATTDDEYVKYMQEFGADLEALSEADARRVIKEIDDNHNSGLVKCERCENAITGVALPDGTTMTASELIAKSKLTYYGVYCFECMKQLKKEQQLKKARKAG